MKEKGAFLRESYPLQILVVSKVGPGNNGAQKSFIFQSLPNRLNGWLKPYVDLEPFELAIAMTLAVFCIERHSEPQLLMLSVFGLLVPVLARSGLYWILITILNFAGYWDDLWIQSNHSWLYGYWSIAITLSLFCPDPKKALAESARWLIVLVFFFAVIWKITSVEYIDGRYFDYCILADVRFTPIGLLCGIDGQTAAMNRDLLSAYVYLADVEGSVQLTTTKWVPFASFILTWWTLFIEFAVCISFALPKRIISHFWRHASLIIFIYTTYSLAQVNGFGWILTAMGISQIKLNSKPLYLGLYLLGFVCIFCSTHPGIRGLLAHLNLL